MGDFQNIRNIFWVLNMNFRLSDIILISKI
jgi:hypothetical protein